MTEPTPSTPGPHHVEWVEVNDERKQAMTDLLDALYPNRGPSVPFPANGSLNGGTIVELLKDSQWYDIGNLDDLNLDGTFSARELGLILGLAAIEQGVASKLPANWIEVFKALAEQGDVA